MKKKLKDSIKFGFGLCIGFIATRVLIKVIQDNMQQTKSE